MPAARFSFGLVLLAACVAGPAERAPERAPSTVTAAGAVDAESLAESLFDGNSLQGWVGDPRFWRVEEGVIVGESTPENPCRETSYLVWDGGEAADFELELEWRFPAGSTGANSGVQFRSRVQPTGSVSGYQADLEAGPDWTGGLYEQDGRGVVARRGERVVLDAEKAPSVERFGDGLELLGRVLPDQWNRLRVVAFGPRLSIEVNGELFSETIDLDRSRAARSGRLALQLHAGAPMRVEFRDVRLHARSVPPELALGPPEWIWVSGPVAEGQVAWFRRRFELAEAPVDAELWVSADDRFELWLDGEKLAGGHGWEQPRKVEFGSRLGSGPHELHVRAVNEGGQAGLVLELVAELDGGRTFRLASGPSFEARTELDTLGADASLLGASPGDDAASWELAQSLGALGVDPWGTLREPQVSAGEAPAAATIHVPPGFTVERLYSVPLDTQGSWVALATVPNGRLVASDQYGGLYRITPARAAGEETRVSELAIPLGEAHGLLWAFDSLYAVVSGAGRYASGLYRARDSDGDGELDEVQCLRTFAGDGEHGPHAIVLHPDGRSLVVVGGNHTALPGPFTRSAVPETWAEDVLIPSLPDPGGHAVGIQPPGGWVVRTDPDGKSWELLAAGLRNSYDLAYSAEGEPFVFDADMEWDVGLPWYRPARILHVVSGADFGWRSGSAKWPADVFDSLPAVVDVGLGSPTGIVFGSETRFPSPWKHALFACDWAYGRVHAVFLEPDGASYRGRYEVFASGEPFAVTDVVVGRDGALYLTIGGRRTQSGLYRIAWAGSGAEERMPLADEGAGARARRQALERHHGARGSAEKTSLDNENGASGPVGLAELGDPDRFVRHAARIALEHQDPATWPAAVLAESEPRRSLAGLLALVHAVPDADPHPILARALAVFAAAPGAGEPLDALRLVELVLLRLEVPEEERLQLRAALDPAYPSADERIDGALLPILVTLEADVAERALAELAEASTRARRIAILYALSVLERGWTEERARALLAAFERELADEEGGASVHGYLEAMRARALERLGTDAAIPEEASAPIAPPDAEPSFPPAEPAPRRAWSVAELESRLAEVSSGRDFAGGASAYASTSCADCHRLGGTGANLGPDLTGAAGRYSARDLLVAILEPSREIPDVWRDLELWGEDRLLAAGRLESERDGELSVREPSGTLVTLDPAHVVERRLHGLSRMPEGLLDHLTADEILDLLAYVLAGGAPDDERFR